MANEKIVREVEIRTNLNTVNKDTDKFNSKLKEAAQTAASVRVPGPVAAARAGMVANASAKPKKTAGEENSGDSNTARGVGGLTGAAGRDFAAQAQGLGGLVHVYATFAANLFAIGAAFTALSKAADTSNMVKGLDQLGASSGRNLGSLAKQLVNATDGALSLRDAMTSTALATAGGLTGENLVRLGNVAKTASQALGINLPDAVSRLSRGITKLEPELLDELGILTRLDKSNTDYARTLGKTVTSLSDFEKHQGFANAVLTEGEKKFGSLVLDANPYSKILASITNLTQAGLELVNRVLGPILNALSSNPVALTAALAGVATILLKQAIPGLTAWKGALKEAAEAADKTAAATSALRKSTYDEAGITAYKKQNLAIQKAEESQVAIIRGANKKLREAINFDVRHATDEQLAILKKAADAEAADTDKKSNKLTYATLAKKKAVQDDVQNTLIQISAAREQAKILDKIEQETLASTKKNIFTKLGFYLSETQQRARIDDIAARKSQRVNIVNTAITDAPTKGIVNSFRDLHLSVQKAREGFTLINDVWTKAGPKMSAFGAGLTYIRGATLLTASAIGVLAASVQNVFIIIGVLVGVFQLFDGWLSTSSKESAAFSEAVDAVGEAVKGVDRTIEAINKKPLLEQFSVESIQAKATALYELTSSLGSVITKFDKLSVALSLDAWDHFFDGFWDLLGKGSGDKLAKSISTTVIEGLRLVEEGPAKEAAKKAIEDIVGQKIDFTSIEKFNATIKDLDKDLIAIKGRSIDKEMDKVSTSASNSASNLTGFKKSLEEVKKQYDILTNSLKPQDEYSKLGITLLESSEKLRKSLLTTTEGAAALLELLKNPEVYSLLPPTIISELKAVGVEIERLRQKKLDLDGTLAIQSKKKPEGLGKFAPSKEQQDILTENPGMKKDILELEKLVLARQQAILNNEKDAIKIRIVAVEEANAKEVKRIKAISENIYEDGVKKLQIGLTTALREASIISAKGYADILKGAGADTAKLDTQLQLEAIDVQITEIKAKYDLVKQLARNEAVTAANTATLQILSTEDSIRAVSSHYSPGRDGDLTQLNTDLAAAKVTRAVAKGTLEALQSGKLTGTSNTGLSEEDTKINVQIRDNLKSVYLSTIGVTGQLAKLNANKGVVALQGRVAESGEKFRQEGRSLQQTSENLATDKAKLDITQNILGQYNEILQTKKETIELDQFDNKYSKDTLDIRKDIAATEIVLSSAKRVNQASEIALENRARLLEELSKKDVNNEGARAALVSKHLQERRIGELALFNILRDYQDKLYEAQNTSSQAALSIREAELAYRKSLDVFDEQSIINDTTALELAKQKLAYDKESAALKSTTAPAVKEAEAKVKDLRDTSKGPTDEAALAAAEAALTRVNTLYTAQQGAIDATNKARVFGIELTKKQSLEQAAFNDLVNASKSIAESLSVIFGDIGSKIGNLAEKFLDFGKKQLDYESARTKLLEDRKATENDDPQAAFIAQKKIDDKISALDSKNAKDQIKNAASVAGAAKNLFKEKTAAYKVFAGVEKALHVASIAMQLKDLAVDAFATGKAVINSLTRSTAKGEEAVVTALTLPPPFGWIAAGITAAMVAAIIGKSVSSGGGSAAAGFNAEDQQKVQGTGQQYVNGELVNRNGGVIGDSTAKSESINKSIGLIEEHSFKNLEFSNKMLEALKRIKENTEGLAQALLLTFNTNGAGTIANDGTKLGERRGNYTSSDSRPGVPKFLTTGFGDKLFGSIFGGKITATLKDQGLSIAGSIGEISTGMSNLIQVFTKVETVRKGGWFRKDKKSFETTFDAASREINEYVGKIFTDTRDTLVEAAGALGKDKTLAKTLLDATDIGSFKVSALNLKPEELAAALQAEISVAFNIAAEAAFPELSKFRKLGEEFGSTVVRLARDTQVVGFALESIGKTLAKIPEIVDAAGVSSTKNLDIIEALITKFGTLDSFVTKTEFFNTNFLTEAQRLAPIQAKVTAEMTRLGFASVTTREGFANIIAGLDLTSNSGQQTYADLLNVSEAFAEVTPPIKQLVDSLAKLMERASELQDQYDKLTMSEADYAAKLRSVYSGQSLVQYDANVLVEKEIKLLTERNDLKKTFSSLEIDLLKAQGKESEALALTRQRELDSIDPANRGIKKLVYARQDEIAAISKQSSLLSSITSAFEAFQSAADAAARTLQSAADAIVNGFIAARDALTAADSGVATARDNALNNAAAAQEALNQAYNGIVQGLAGANAALQAANDGVASEIRRAKDELRGFAKTIRDFIFQITTTNLGPNSSASQYSILKKEFASQAAAAKLGDKEALGKITGTAQALLELARNQSATSIDFARISGSITNTLDQVASITEAAAGPPSPADDPMVNAQNAVASAMAQVSSWQQALYNIQVDIQEKAGQKALDDAKAAADAATRSIDPVVAAQEAANKALTDVANWQHALADAGISGLATQHDLLEEYRTAQTTQVDAQTALARWQDLVNRTGLNTEVNTAIAAGKLGPIDKNIADLLTSYTTAKNDNKIAADNLRDATTTLGTIQLNVLNKVADFKKLVEDYNAVTVTLEEARTAQLDAHNLSLLTEVRAVVTAILTTAATAVTVAQAIADPNAGAGGMGPQPMSDAERTAYENRISAAEQSARDAKTLAENTAEALRLLQDSINSSLFDRNGGGGTGSAGGAGPGGDGYANGGNFSGGLRLVGERGPELENTGPSHIYSTQQTKELFSNTELIKEIRALREEVSSLRYSSEQTQENTRKTKDTLTRVTRDGQSLLTSVAK